MGTTPLPTGTNVSETIGGKEYSRALMADTAGVDAMGLVAASPAPNTMLGRLKAIVDALLGIASADNFFAIAPGASPLTVVPKALYITGAGTVIVKGADGVSATFEVPAFSVLSIRPRFVTGGTATGIIGLV